MERVDLSGMGIADVCTVVRFVGLLFDPRVEKLVEVSVLFLHRDGDYSMLANSSGRDKAEKVWANETGTHQSHVALKS